MANRSWMLWTMSFNRHHALAEYLLRIEQEMRRLDLWHTEVPDPDALQSIQPFCFDTLDFTQWLQFIFLPRMKVIVEHGLTLPSSCDIAPMAEECFKQVPENTEALLTLLVECDRVIVGCSGPEA